MMLILRRNIKKWLEEGFNLTLINDPDVANKTLIFLQILNHCCYYVLDRFIILSERLDVIEEGKKSNSKKIIN